MRARGEPKLVRGQPASLYDRPINNSERSASVVKSPNSDEKPALEGEKSASFGDLGEIRWPEVVTEVTAPSGKSQRFRE